MGRPRKQPRRIVTFNLDLTTADRIDALGLKNRSEWANRALLEVMDGRLAQRQDLLERHNEATIDAVESEILEQLSNDPRRLAAMLANSLIRNGLISYTAKGRYSLYNQLSVATGRTAKALPDPLDAEEKLRSVEERAEAIRQSIKRFGDI